MTGERVLVEVRLHAVLAELAGIRRHRVRVPRRLTVRGLLEALGTELPGLARISEHRINVIAVRDGEPLPEEFEAREGDVIDLLPPSSGG